ncbi:MAG: hypothetical protein PHD39_05385, partial [Methylobacter tundripaludum]|nr:hypothetical protein [Methylobacter tundripaludum]
LTAAGKVLFEQAVPEHLDYVHRIFKGYSPEDIATLEAALLRLRKSVIAASCDGSGKLVDGTDGWCAKVKDVCKNYQDSL